MKRFILILLALALVTPAQAEMTVKQFTKACNSGDGSLGQGLCMGYVTGAIEILVAMQVHGAMRSAVPEEYQICRNISPKDVLQAN